MAEPCIDLVWRDADGRTSVLRWTVARSGALNEFAKAMVAELPECQVSEAVWRAVAGERSEEISRLRLLLRDYGRVIDDRQDELLKLRRQVNPTIAEVSG